MADKTFGVKVSEDLYDKVKLMIDASGITSKEWFEKAVSLSELNEIKQGASDYRQDLSELEVHTTRIYELISNMIQRSIYIKDHAVKEYADKLDQKEAIISEYQAKASTAIEEAKTANEVVEILEKEKEDLLKQQEDMRSVNLNTQRLIDEYKEKNDTLNGLVAKYQSFAEENEQLKEDFSKKQYRLESQVRELTDHTHDQQDEISRLNQQIETINHDHEIELERLNERKDYEKERAVIESERSYQDRLLKANEEYNERIKELYSEMSAVRKDYEDKIRGLEHQLTQSKKETDEK